MASAGRSGGPYPNYIAAERDTQGLSQVELAARSGIDRPWLSRIENGQALCTPAQVDAIADALGVSAGRLYDRESLEFIGWARRQEADHVASEAPAEPAATTRGAA